MQEAFQQRPELEQAVLTLRNDEITLKGARNALLPTLDVYGFYRRQCVGGSQSPYCKTFHAANLSCTGKSRQSATEPRSKICSIAALPTRAWASA